jgi:membrane protein required for colicin V production
MLDQMALLQEAPTALEQVRNLAPLDIVGLSIVGLLVLLGLWRGLWWQVIRLLGLVAAVALARVFSPEVGLWISETWTELSPRLAHGTAWVSVFLLTLGAASILGLIGQRILEAMQLGLANRLGGAVVGALTGVLVHLAALVVFCQLAPEGFVADHVPGTYSERLVNATGNRWRVVLGAEAADEIQRVFDRMPATVEDPAWPASEPEGGVVR